jgi:hypothetical protein
MTARNPLLETLDAAAARLGSATLALRAEQPIAAATFIREAIKSLNTVTSEMRQTGADNADKT